MKSSVSIVKCQNYEEAKVLSALRQSIGLIGGIQNYVKKGSRVLLKPNLLFGKSPEKAVTTHPSILRGMIQIVREAGGVPSIGDSPSVGSLTWTAEKAGIKAVADEMKCPLVEFNRPALPPKGGGTTFKQLEVDQAVLEADVIINLPKFKTHSLTLLTLGVKNLFGCVPGPKKPLWHLKAGKDQKTFAKILVDIYEVIRPSLTLLDGIVGMEGNGPNSGRPIPIGLILASGDSLSLDQIVCDLLGISRESLLTNRVAFEQGMGRDPIDVLGEKIEDLKISNFQFPALSQPNWNLPGFLSKALKNALTSKPVIEGEVCESCDRCAEICPPKALARRGEDLVFDYGQCIRCLCCLEVCPEGAISNKPGWALRLVGRR
ncbi:MAG: hypothetical protein A2157_02410 [Deltaproteobacteria bacterium RBG_16_47_11]|nr:MAG: hypothetical protein A2157_02410 [Deltaproteobacteria bacterium RBG_16_47_11]